jgi:enolase
LKINSLSFYHVLDSHAELTTEFVVELDDGRVGAAAAPRGETISVYEDRGSPSGPEPVLARLKKDAVLDAQLSQETFDAYLAQNVAALGRNNAFALSLALFNAQARTEPVFRLLGRPEPSLRPPNLCLNILNGGMHAYTNPVLSDFSEFMLVSRGNDIEKIVHDHKEIQKTVREGLNKLERVVVNGNPVHKFRTPDNRECIEFLLRVREGLGLAHEYDLMIDASAGDLTEGGGYTLALTDGKNRSGEQFLEYWRDLMRQHGIKFAEDPFHETDFALWAALSGADTGCMVVGDNLYSSDAARIEDGARRRLSHAAVIKPNQSGTVTAAVRAIETAERHGMVVITSHRSISTESTFLSSLTCARDVKYVKIGPLLTDYSSVVRLNEIIRLTTATD